MTVRVLIVEDEKLIRGAIRSYVDAFNGGDAGKRIFIADKQSILMVTNQLRHAALIRTDDGPAGRHGFKTSIGAIFPKAGEQKNISLP